MYMGVHAIHSLAHPMFAALSRRELAKEFERCLLARLLRHAKTFYGHIATYTCKLKVLSTLAYHVLLLSQGHSQQVLASLKSFFYS